MQETIEFLNALGKSSYTFQTISDKAQFGDKLTRVFHGEFKNHILDLQKLNKRHAGVFFMVNDGDLKGRKAENVTKVTCYFADLDGEPLRENYPLQPTAIIQSSEGRYHLYWRVKDANLETFSHIQHEVAVKLNADVACKDLPRIMRLPGFYHMKGKPQRAETLLLLDNIYSSSEFIQAFEINESKPRKEYIPLPQAALDFLGKKYKGIGGNLKSVSTAGEGQRNITLFKQAAAIKKDVEKGLIGEEEAYAGLYEAGLLAGLDSHEINKTIQSAWSYGGLN